MMTEAGGRRGEGVADGTPLGVRSWALAQRKGEMGDRRLLV
ncbi:hypothetical protein [[Phormidium] sp. ETS-05]|nr:hypothetical protein [[Phormidium] sp. ETS-05]